MAADPHEVYSQLLAARRGEIAALEGRHRTLGYGRLAVALAGCGIAWMALAERAVSLAWVLAPLAAFIALVVFHERLLRLAERKRRAARYFERALARLDGHWAGAGETGERYLDPAHPYAQDLDLFGRGSLFELLSSARTDVGEDTLARWLLAPARPETIRARQQAVEELRERLDLREALAVVAEEARTGVDPVGLAAWGEGQGPALDTRKMLTQVRVLAGLGVLAAGAGIALMAGPAAGLRTSEGVSALLRDWLLVVVAANGYYLYTRHKLLSAVVSAVERAAHELGLLSEVLLTLERETFRSPLLKGLRASLDADGGPPSAHLARLKRLVEYLDSRDNVFVRVAEVFILWTPHWALQVEEWRRRSGPAVRRWLAATGEIEALSSLASHAFEHPADAFPELLECAAPCLRAGQVAHPLLPEARAVRNDVSLGGPAGPVAPARETTPGPEGTPSWLREEPRQGDAASASGVAGEPGPAARLLVVSGSNMSGKSTLLRTLGINVVLAQAGAPVRARRMALAPMAVGASIRVVDSLQGGVSRFYAELLRLRQIVDLTAGGLPVLFLIDEFFHGTNSHDRRMGAEALVRGLLKRGACGLVTTHDLALAEIVESLDGQGANVHFEDHLENGQIRFDYVMRPGVVRKSNALELMRSVGLDI